VRGDRRVAIIEHRADQHLGSDLGSAAIASQQGDPCSQARARALTRDDHPARIDAELLGARRQPAEGGEAVLHGDRIRMLGSKAILHGHHDRAMAGDEGEIRCHSAESVAEDHPAAVQVEDAGTGCRLPRGMEDRDHDVATGVARDGALVMDHAELVHQAADRRIGGDRTEVLDHGRRDRRGNSAGERHENTIQFVVEGWRRMSRHRSSSGDDAHSARGASSVGWPVL
jgi:hypothetical protein